MPRETIIHALWRQNRKMPVIVAVLLALNLLGWSLVGRVLVPRVDTARRALLQEQDRQRRQLAQGGALTGLSGYREGREALDRFTESLLNKERLTVFLGEVYTLANDAGLRIDQISYKPEVIAEQDLLRYTLNFAVAGNYAQVKKFIGSLEFSEMIMILDKVSLSGEQAEKDRVSLRLQMTTYFKSDEP